MSYWSQKTQRHPTLLGYPLWLKGRNIRLKIPLTLVVGLQHNNLTLTRKLSPNWLASSVLEDAMLASGRARRYQFFLPKDVTLMTWQARYDHSCNSSSMAVKGVIELEAYYTGRSRGNEIDIVQSEDWIWEDHGSYHGPFSSCLLNGHASKLLSPFLCLY